jgi:hypothetical protein
MAVAMGRRPSIALRAGGLLCLTGIYNHAVWRALPGFYRPFNNI